MDPIALRATERILVVVFAGMSIYLGYRLFLQIPDRAKGEGKITLPGGVSIFLTRLGPGAFFAVFGATILGLSLHYAVTASTSDGRMAVTGESPAGRTVYQGLGEMPARPLTAQDRATARADLRGDLTVLNEMTGQLRADLPPEQRAGVKLALPRIKARLLTSTWDKDLGDQSAFAEWIGNGASDPVPRGLETAAALFREGEKKPAK